MGVQIDEPNLTLTITDNQPLTPDTIRYLNVVWDNLQSLSDLYPSRRTDVSENHPSPKFARSKIAADLAKLVYTLTSGKNNKHRAKRWGGDGLLDFWRKFRARKGSGLDSKDGQFEIMTTKLSIALQCLRGEIVGWAEVDNMTDVTDLADDLLADPSSCEILAVDITGIFPFEIVDEAC